LCVVYNKKEVVKGKIQEDGSVGIYLGGKTDAAKQPKEVAQMSATCP
jgi:hypothetical protein